VELSLLGEIDKHFVHVFEVWSSSADQLEGCQSATFQLGLDSQLEAWISSTVQ
jgi:hypothetical protein